MRKKDSYNTEFVRYIYIYKKRKKKKKKKRERERYGHQWHNVYTIAHANQWNCSQVEEEKHTHDWKSHLKNKFTGYTMNHKFIKPVAYLQKLLW
jgi:hypothetical protein